MHVLRAVVSGVSPCQGCFFVYSNIKMEVTKYKLKKREGGDEGRGGDVHTLCPLCYLSHMHMHHPFNKSTEIMGYFKRPF